MEDSHKVLIVEDESITAMCLKIELESYGLVVCNTAPNSEKAIMLAKQEQPDVILMDIRLAKGTNGIETSKIIRKDLPDIPIIYMTGYEDEQIKNEAMVLNPLGFVIKPVDVPDVVTLIDTYFHDK